MSNDYIFSDSEQKLYIDIFIKNHDLFTRCKSIIKPVYFNKNLREAVKFMIEYSDEYHAVPAPEIINSKINYVYDEPMLSVQDENYILSRIETFCRHKDVSLKILEAPELIDKGEYATVEQGLKDALLISLDKDMGSNFFTDFEKSLREMQDNNGTQATGIKLLDKKLYGGFNRGELNIILARSGGGKSLAMQNISVNWALAGLDVVYFSFELSEALINKRLGSMVTGIAQQQIMKNLEDVGLRIAAKGKKSNGKLIVKAMPQGSTVNDLRAYLKEYEIKFGKAPDAIAVDYLDLMYPNNKRVDPSNLFIKDKFVSEELRGLAIDLKMLLVTASQVNREGSSETEIDPKHIAGGMSKINTADNVIAAIMTDVMKERGEMLFQLIKTRSSGNSGQKLPLAFDIDTLQITDRDEDSSDSSLETSTTDNLMNSIRRSAVQAQSGKSSDSSTQNSNSNTSQGSNSDTKSRIDTFKNMMTKAKF